MTKVHIIPHTHWDREWYFTAEHSRVLLVYFMEELLEMLETNDDFKYFMLDGQSVILDDYLEIKPENENRITELVKEGKLLVGPWYTQTDELIVSGESMVRNLYYGIDRAEDFGDWMKVGYLPDSFGQSAQIPQILKGFGIDRAVFWRGLAEMDTEDSEFYWSSPDGSEVFAVNLPLGYAIGKYLPAESESARERIDSIIEKIGGKATTANVLIPNGHDQMPVQEDLTDLVDSLNEIENNKDYIVSNLDKYIDSVRSERDQFDLVEGELTHQKNMRIHRSIYSTRYDIKKANSNLEKLISNQLEPVMTIAWKLGLPYQHQLIEKAWKEIFKSQAHDSLGSCCTDQVHKEVKDRFEIASDICSSLLAMNLRRIADGVDTDYENSLLVINPLPYQRRGVIKAQFTTDLENFNICNQTGEKLDFQIISKEKIDIGTVDRRIAHQGEKLYLNKIEAAIELKELPGLGYKTLSIIPADAENEVELEAENSGSDKIIENEYYTVELNENGSINLYDKENDKKTEGILVFEDGGDAGDEYNYSPPKAEYQILTDDQKAELEVKKGPVFEEILIKQSLKIPKDLKSRNKKEKNTELPLEVKISLQKKSKLVKVNVKTENGALDHRLRVLFKTGISTKVSYADQQFGIVERDNYPAELDYWEEENWSEKPVPIYPMQSFVDLNDGDYGLSIITDGIREYEIIGDDYDTIALTLFRSVGVIGQADLVDRPGRASGVSIPTPESQMLGDLEFDFAIYPHQGDTAAGEVAKRAKEYLSDIIAYHKTDYHIFRTNINPKYKDRGKFPKDYSLIDFESKNIVSTIKKAEKSDEIVLRVFNPNLEALKDGGRVEFKDKIEKAKLVNLKEDDLEDIEIQENDFKLQDFRGCQLKTYKVKLK